MAENEQEMNVSIRQNIRYFWLTFLKMPIFWYEKFVGINQQYKLNTNLSYVSFFDQSFY